MPAPADPSRQLHLALFITGVGHTADGFVIMPPTLPGGLDTFVEEVVPLLRARGLFREEYAGTTLRDHLGLPRPANRWRA